jgi:hypothetical protein
MLMAEEASVSQAMRKLLDGLGLNFLALALGTAGMLGLTALLILWILTRSN